MSFLLFVPESQQYHQPRRITGTACKEGFTVAGQDISDVNEAVVFI